MSTPNWPRSRLERLQRQEPALALYMLIAWRVLYLTMIGRLTL